VCRGPRHTSRFSSLLPAHFSFSSVFSLLISGARERRSRRPCGKLSAPKSRPLGLRYAKGPDGTRGFAMKRPDPRGTYAVASQSRCSQTRT